MFKRLAVGEHCPLNETTWMARKAQFNCTDTGGNPSKEYHCLPDNFGVPGEVCIGSSWVQPNFCPVFNLNAKNFDAQPCDLPRGECSTSEFQSKDVYKFSGCLNFTRQPDPVINGYKPLSFLPVIVGGVSLVCLLVIIVCVVWLCRRRGGKKGGKKEKNGDVEMQEPLVERFPEEFHRICHYLRANTFYPTKVYTKCIGLFDVKGSLTLVGPQGSGKTTVAVSLLNKMVGTVKNDKKCSVDVCYSVKQVESKVADGTTSCVLLDGVLEKYAYQPELLKEDIPKFKDLERLITEGKLCLICTVTDTTWKNIAKAFDGCSLFDKDHVINLTEKSPEKHEKLEILKMHLSFNKFCIADKAKEENLGKVNKRQEEASAIIISGDTLRNWAKKAKVKNGIGIPLLFDLMSVNRHLFASADTLLADSLESVLKMRITHLWKGTKDQMDKDIACLLVFTACFGGKVSLGDFKSKENVYVAICSKTGCSMKTETEIQNILKSKEMDAFLYPLNVANGSYIFHHRVLTPLVLSVVVKDNASLVVDHAELDVLFKVLQPLKAKYPMSVTLTDPALLDLITKRINMEKSDVVDKWKQHAVMQPAKLQKAFKSFETDDGVKKGELCSDQN